MNEALMLRRMIGPRLRQIENASSFYEYIHIGDIRMKGGSSWEAKNFPSPKTGAVDYVYPIKTEGMEKAETASYEDLLHLAEGAVENGEGQGESEYVADGLTHFDAHQTERARQNDHQWDDEETAACRR